jgi:hypothetical protein
MVPNVAIVAMPRATNAIAAIIVSRMELLLDRLCSLSALVKPVRPPAMRSQAGEIYSRGLSIEVHEDVI